MGYQLSVGILLNQPVECNYTRYCGLCFEQLVNWIKVCHVGAPTWETTFRQLQHRSAKLLHLQYTFTYFYRLLFLVVCSSMEFGTGGKTLTIVTSTWILMNDMLPFLVGIVVRNRGCRSTVLFSNPGASGFAWCGVQDFLLPWSRRLRSLPRKSEDRFVDYACSSNVVIIGDPCQGLVFKGVSNIVQKHPYRGTCLFKTLTRRLIY